MKNYSKRLLVIFISFLLVITVSALFISPIFSMSAEDLDITLSDSLSQSESTGRSKTDDLPALEEINGQGYDTSLPDGFSKVLEDESSALYFKQETGEIALKDTATGQIWLSNPDDLDGETMVEGTTKKRIGAQLTVSYYDSQGNSGQMDSYNDCIVYGNMTYSVSDGCLSVNYRLGKTVVTLADVPQQMSKTRFDEFTENLSKEDLAYLQEQYGLATVEGATDSYKQRLVEKYPNVEQDDIYYLKYDSTRILTQVKAIWDKCGYTYDDLNYDNTENKVETEVTSRAYFVICLDYRLADGALQVTMDGSKLQYDNDIPPNEIRLLEYFGAGNTEDKGYMLLPDGSGSLIYYNNGKTKETAFSMPVYGDNTVTDTESDYVADNKLSLPVYGIKRGAAALLVTIDEGASLCSLNARVAGMSNSYNTVYPSFLVTDHDSAEISTDSTQVYNEKEPYRGEYVVTYRALAEDKADYIGMAREYRSLLLQDGTLNPTAVSGTYPLLADYICCVPATELVLGIPVDTLEAVTTFSQVQEITQSLRDAGIDGLAVRIEGWMNGGLAQKYVGSLKVESKLGGKTQLAVLSTFLSSAGIAFYPDVYISSVFAKGNGFNVSKWNIRNLCRDISVRYYYDYMNRYRRTDDRSIYQLSPACFRKAATSFLSNYNNLSIESLSLPDFSSILYSDFRTNNAYNREMSLEKTTEALEQLAGSNSIAMSNPNLYSLTYGNFVYDLPTEDSSYRLCDESVPFYQTVIRGLMDYVSPSLNYTDDYETALLEAVEFGSGLQYTLTGNSTSSLKDTDYNYLNKGHCTDWEDIIAEDYARAAAIMNPLQGVEIVGHERIVPDFYRTDYADGTSVYVNYSEESMTADGITVNGRSFAAVTGGK